VKHDRLQILQPEFTEEIGPPGRGSVHRSSGDDFVRAFYFPQVTIKHGIDWNLGADLPGIGQGLRRVIGLAGDDVAESESLDVDREVLDQPQARPSRREYRTPQSLFGKALQDPQHVRALFAQG
jgi:hypothetical protein